MACIWKNIYEREKLHLQSGQYRRGDNFLSPSELARMYNINYLTARRVLNTLAENHYLTQAAVGEFKVTGIGVVTKIYFLAPGPLFCNHVTSSSWMLMQQGVFEEAMRLQQHITPISFDECLELPTDPAVLLFISGSTRFSDEIFFKFLPPTVYPIIINGWHKSSTGASIGSNNTQMMYDLTNHFIKHGKTKVGYIGLTGEGRICERFEGYYNALVDHNLKFMPSMVYAFVQGVYKNILELSAWIEREKLDAICTPSVDDIDFLERNLSSNIFNKLQWGTIGKPKAIQPNYCYVQPDYIGQGNLAVKLALEADPLTQSQPEYYPVPAHLKVL